MTHSKEADSYTVGFTIMDQWSSARKEESDEHDSTRDEQDADQKENDNDALDDISSQRWRGNVDFKGSSD